MTDPIALVAFTAIVSVSAVAITGIATATYFVIQKPSGQSVTLNQHVGDQMSGMPEGPDFDYRRNQGRSLR